MIGCWFLLGAVVWLLRRLTLCFLIYKLFAFFGLLFFCVYYFRGVLVCFCGFCFVWSLVLVLFLGF